jgi:hypothetical protein
MARSSPATIARKLIAADRRTAWPRRFAALLDLYLAELHDPTPAQVSLARRVVTLEIALENVESKMAAGDDDPALLDLYARASGGLGRLLRLLGIEHRTKDITPNLEQYIASLPPSARPAIKE